MSRAVAPETAPSRGTVAVTGATGLVGSALCAALADRRWSVRALSRLRPAQSSPDIRWFMCDLPDDIDPVGFERCQVVIHAAYATRPASLAQARRVNEGGTRRILELTRRTGARFVFISSFSAHESARSYYGRSKLALERILDPAHDLIIRPGLVLSPSGGVFGAMLDQIRARRIIPLIGGGNQALQTVHIDDLCNGIAEAVQRGLTGTISLAEPSPIPLRRFLELVAGRLGRSPIFLPLPAWPILAATRTLEACGLQPPISSENIRGLLALRAAETGPDLRKLHVIARSAAESLRDLPLAPYPH